MTNLSLAIDNENTRDIMSAATILSGEDKALLNKKAMLIAEIIVLQNRADIQKEKWNRRYCEAVLKDNADEMIRFRPYVMEYDAKIKAYGECIDLIKTKL